MYLHLERLVKLVYWGSAYFGCGEMHSTLENTVCEWIPCLTSACRRCSLVSSSNFASPLQRPLLGQDSSDCGPLIATSSYLLMFMPTASLSLSHTFLKRGWRPPILPSSPKRAFGTADYWASCVLWTGISQWRWSCGWNMLGISWQHNTEAIAVWHTICP